MEGRIIQFIKEKKMMERNSERKEEGEKGRKQETKEERDRQR